MRRMLFCAAISAALLAYAPVFAADDAATNAAEPSEAAPAAPDASAKPVLTPEELAEKEARKECKKKICDIIATRDPNGEDVACDIAKTWREEDIVKMLGGKISWPWGKAVCQSKLELQAQASRLGDERIRVRDRHAGAKSPLYPRPERRKASLMPSRSPWRRR